MRLIFLVILYILPISVTSQALGQTIEGVVKDAETGDSIPFAHITGNEGKGTVSNQSGDFLLEKIADGSTIVVSHIGYRTKQLEVADTSKMEILLEPNVIVLAEVTLIDDSIARAIASEVMASLAKCKNEYGKAFYRQIGTHDTIYTSFAEGFYDLAYSCSGVELVNLKQARFAYKKSDTIPFFRYANFDYLSIGMNLYGSNQEPDINAMAKPFSLAYFKDYEFKLHRQWATNGDTLVEVQFYPGVKLRPVSSLQGSFIYNCTRAQLLQQKLTILHSLGADNIEIKSKDENRNDEVEMLNPKYRWEVFYAENTNLINHLLVGFSYEYSLNGKIFPCSVYSHFTIYEKLNKKPRRLAEAKVTDHYSLQNAKYRPRYWRDNPVVKRTQEEEIIINTFEKENAFGSYFK